MQQIRQCEGGGAGASARRAGLLLPARGADGRRPPSSALPRQDRLCGEDQRRADRAEDAGRGRHRLPSTSPRRASSPRCAPSRRLPSCSTCIRSRRSPTSGSRSRPTASASCRSTTRTRSPRSAHRARARLDPGEITLFVRLQTKGQAAYELSQEVRRGARRMRWSLLQRIDRIGFKVGLCFHVGSQIEDPDTYERALASADWVRSRAGVPLAGLDIGGGFPGRLRPRSAPRASRRCRDSAELMSRAARRHRRMGLRRPAARRRARPRDRRALASR